MLIYLSIFFKNGSFIFEFESHIGWLSTIRVNLIKTKLDRFTHQYCFNHHFIYRLKVLFFLAWTKLGPSDHVGHSGPTNPFAVGTTTGSVPDATSRVEGTPWIGKTILEGGSMAASLIAARRLFTFPLLPWIGLLGANFIDCHSACMLFCCSTCGISMLWTGLGVCKGELLDCFLLSCIFFMLEMPSTCDMSIQWTGLGVCNGELLDCFIQSCIF